MGGKHRFAGRTQWNPELGPWPIAEYDSWRGLRRRCDDPKSEFYYRYGARGITYSDRWVSFECFYADMGPKPGKEYSIERIDNDGNYEPKNCKWATKKEQAGNKNVSRWLECNGKRMILADWAKYFGVNQSTVREHLFTKSFQEVFDYYEKVRTGERRLRFMGKLTDSDVLLIRKMKVDGVKQNVIARTFAVAQSTIFEILKNNRYKQVK